MNEKETHVGITQAEKGSRHITLIVPAPQCDLTFDEILEKDAPADHPRFKIHRDELPGYFEDFFKAWVADFEAETVSVDMDIARDITADMIRTQRKPKLEELDVQYMRASEAKDDEKMAEIVAMKQVLRDLPASPAIQEAKTLGDLNRLAQSSVETAIGGA